MDMPKFGSLKSLETMDIIRFFAYDHLNEPMRSISQHFFDTAVTMTKVLPDNMQLRQGLLSLLQAKDCFVRSSLDLPQYPTEDADHG